ncbi:MULTISPECIES: ABC transporter permease [Mesorhizobium]|uniref:ABC transporter permease n=1 Tax=Mesorhizobium TaxID=68287 RepID=UPI00041550C1|nr:MULTISPECIES: ABC transporter permease [Mesorhizobium]WJI35777.1 ABC transporter permease [Mesorhizobium opportunistum]
MSLQALGALARNPRIERSQHLLVPIILVFLLLLVAALRGPRLFTSDGIGGAIIVAAPLILAALALTPIALAGRGGVDLSVGPLLGFINVSLVKWLVENGVTSPVLVVGYVVAAGVIYQVLMAAIIIYVRVAPIIVTLSGYLVLTGVNLVVMDRPSGFAPDWMQDWGYGTAILSPIFYILVGMIVLWFAFSRTAFYQQILLTGADERMAFANGVNTVAARFGAHIVAGIFTGVAALTYTALIASGDPTQGNTYTLAAVTALVLGGTSLAGGSGGGLGSILGAISIYLISYALSTYSFGNVSGYVTQLSTGGILILSLLVNSLMNKKGGRP